MCNSSYGLRSATPAAAIIPAVLPQQSKLNQLWLGAAFWHRSGRNLERCRGQSCCKLVCLQHSLGRGESWHFILYHYIYLFYYIFHYIIYYNISLYYLFYPLSNPAGLEFLYGVSSVDKKNKLWDANVSQCKNLTGGEGNHLVRNSCLFLLPNFDDKGSLQETSNQIWTWLHFANIRRILCVW